MQRLLVVAIVSALLTAVCIVTIDQPLARWLATRETYPALWNEVIGYLEYPLGIEPWPWTGVTVLVAGSIATLAVTRLRSYAAVFLLVTLTHLLARHASLWGKWLTGRLRPKQWIEAGGGDTFWRDGFSFPSGHVLLFASIVVPIVLVYPRARPLVAIVGFVMAARVMVSAHFVSDVTGGLACVALLAWVSALVIRRVLPAAIVPPALGASSANADQIGASPRRESGI